MADDVRFKTPWPLMGACVIVAIAFLATSSALAFADDQHDGRVSAITDAHLILTVETVDYTYRWNEETAFTLNGESAEATDLRAGDSASVISQRAEDGVLLAMSVDAVRR
jgi:hypothetical protein